MALRPSIRLPPTQLVKGALSDYFNPSGEEKATPKDGPFDYALANFPFKASVSMPFARSA